MVLLEDTQEPSNYHKGVASLRVGGGGERHQILPWEHLRRLRIIFFEGFCSFLCAVPLGERKAPESLSCRGVYGRCRWPMAKSMCVFVCVRGGNPKAEVKEMNSVDVCTLNLCRCKSQRGLSKDRAVDSGTEAPPHAQSDPSQDTSLYRVV